MRACGSLGLSILVSELCGVLCLLSGPLGVSGLMHGVLLYFYGSRVFGSSRGEDTYASLRPFVFCPFAAFTWGNVSASRNLELCVLG